MDNEFSALKVSAGSLPIIDISGLSSGDPGDRMAVASALRASCQDKGFFYITNHGIDPALQQRIFEASRAFFSLPPEDKKRIDKADSRANRGYEMLRGQTLEEHAPPDLKEGFYMGRDLPDDHPNVLAGRFNQGANLWPQGISDFRPALEQYYHAMIALAERLMGGLALSLSLPEDYFNDFCVNSESIVRLLHYPPQPANPLPNEKGCGAHTDFGAITLLLQDENPGLQVWNQARQAWMHADPIPGTYVGFRGFPRHRLQFAL